jgi:predicted TIM-barrel fold metal-dependent hydrolase
VMDRLESTYAMLLARGMVRELREPPRRTLARLYFDTSGSLSRAALAAALEVVPADHVLFGTDLPTNRAPRAAVDRIRGWDLGAPIEAGLLGGNLMKLLTRST